MTGSGNTAESVEAGRWSALFEFALQPPPTIFTLSRFAVRLAQHAIVYTAVLIAATSCCLFVFAPVETSIVAVGILAVLSVAVAMSSSSRVRVRRLIEHGLAATYAVGAGALLKAITEFLHHL